MYIYIYVLFFTCVPCSIFHVDSSKIFKVLLFDLTFPPSSLGVPASVAKGAEALFEVPARNMGAVTRAAARLMGIAAAIAIPRSDGKSHDVASY